MYVHKIDAPSACNGAPGCDATTNDWNCCTSSNPCAVGEGDCDTDSDCDANLVCGTDNCKSFDSAWSSSSFDCCIEGKKKIPELQR